MNHTEDWYDPAARKVMSIEDAHGGELLEAIQKANGQSNNLIQQMVAHAPMVANSLMMLDHHYTRLFSLIEAHLRLKKDRPEGELQQLEILGKLNAYLKNGYNAHANIRITRMRHGTVYSESYAYGNRFVPAQNYVLSVGQASPIAWTADLNEHGLARVAETFGVLMGADEKPTDGECVVTELLPVAMPDVVFSEAEFMRLLLAESEKPVTPGLVWPQPRICFTQQRPDWRNAISYMRQRFNAYSTEESKETRNVRHFDFQYDHAFCVGDRRPDRSIFSDRVNSAMLIPTDDLRYAMLFYKDDCSDPFHFVLWELAAGVIRKYHAEWEVEEYLKDNLSIFEADRPAKSTSLYGPELVDAAGFWTESKSFEWIHANKELIFDEAEQISKCVKIYFHAPLIIDSGFLGKCTHAFAFTREDKEGNITKKIEFCYETIDKINLNTVMQNY